MTCGVVFVALAQTLAGLPETMAALYIVKIFHDQGLLELDFFSFTYIII